MLLHRRTPVIAAAALALSMLVPAALYAAGPGRVNVPKNILTGSSVIKGRSFYRPTAREDTLGGIRLGREAREVLSRWGNPTRIVVGGGGGEEAAPVALAGPGYMPPPGNPYAPMGTAMNTAAGMLGMTTSPGGPLTGGLPPLPGYPMPGMAPPAGGPAAGGGGGANLSEDEVTWTYDCQGGITLEFVITDGLVTQITVGGTGPWGLSKTHTGLQLGDTYKLVWWVCGYPESQRFVNSKYLRVSYVNKMRVVYTLLKNKVVGVTIALVPQDIT